MEAFDKAIRLDPTNPAPYITKGHIQMQTTGDVNGAKGLFEKALEVDPKCQMAYMNMAQMKLHSSATLDECREAVTLYDRSAELCRVKEELVEVCSYKAAAVAQIEAAEVLGL